MASPQKENGYTPIANELLDALAKIRISGEARQVFDVIIRKTYGYNKSQDAISLSQFMLSTGLKKQTVVKALAKLRLLNVITQLGYSMANKYGINKDFHTWKPQPKKVTKPNKVISVTKLGYKRNPKRVLQKTVTKDNTTKDIIAAKPPDEIVLLLDFFKQTVNPHINFGNKTERKACTDLLKTYGLEKTKEALLYLEEKRKTDRYLPTITTPYELWTKWAKIKQHLQTKNVEKKGIRI